MNIKSISFLLLFMLLVLNSCQLDNKTRKIGQVSFESDNKELNNGFKWAKKQALEYTFTNDTVGLWYEASLPGRQAFCMRDVSHQCMGAQVLGLEEFNRNILEKFAASISETRDWCGYWEINKDNLPAPVDYKNDSNFWYNLPANFDVMDACYRMYQWTGDTSYLSNPVFLNFYEKTVTDYISSWDQDNDGCMESPQSNWPRGIPTYWESDQADFVTGSDLLASMYSAFYVYSKINAINGDSAMALLLMNRADSIRFLFNKQWWDPVMHSYYHGKKSDGNFVHTKNQLLNFYPLYHDLIEGSDRELSVLKNIKNPSNVEELSYLSEIFFKYNKNEKAFHYLLEQLNPDLQRREYPEVSYTAIGAIASGLMGVRPRASQNLVETSPHLPKQLNWAEMKNIPVFQNLISIKHIGLKESLFTNNSGKEILWQASFPVISNVLNLNGEKIPCERFFRKGQTFSFILVKVKPGETFSVSVPF